MVEEVTPIQRSGREVTVELSPAAPTPSSTSEEFPKYFNRETTLAVSFRTATTLIECTRYPGWKAFKEMISLVLDAREEIGRPDGVERIGLRYVDEIRIKESTNDHPDWSDWVSVSLLGPQDLEPIVKLPRTQSQGVAIYGSEPGMALALRYGPRIGFVVDPKGELRKKDSDVGPLFVIDMDSFWVPEDGTPEFSSSMIIETAEQLHTPVRETFEALITDRLREEVLRRA